MISRVQCLSFVTSIKVESLDEPVGLVNTSEIWRRVYVRGFDSFGDIYTTSTFAAQDLEWVFVAVDSYHYKSSQG